MPRRNSNVAPDRRTSWLGPLSPKVIRHINATARRRGWAA
jgi:hypothetical protein